MLRAGESAVAGAGPTPPNRAAPGRTGPVRIAFPYLRPEVVMGLAHWHRQRHASAAHAKPGAGALRQRCNGHMGYCRLWY